MDILRSTILVFAGGGLGASVRFLLGTWIAERTAATFPWNTLAINVSGALLIGLLLGYLLNVQAAVGWRLFLVVGVLGGYTTFSTFSLETVNLLRERSYLYAFGNIAASILLGLGATWAGLLLSGAGSRG